MPKRGPTSKRGRTSDDIVRSAAIALQRRVWNRRAVSWDEGAAHNPGLVKVVDAVLARAGGTSTDVALDLGCGSGQLTLPLARTVGRVIAVDVSEAMTGLLKANAAAAGIANVETIVTAVEELDLAPASVDVIVSNYVLHHVDDAAKARVVQEAARWLKPGGKLVIGDIMIGRGGDARDRQVIASKVAVLVRKGPGGWWRIAKNVVRYLARVQERPVAMHVWVALLERAGLESVKAEPVVAEAAVVSGVRAGTAGTA
ncbi:MAG: class I SAM-dependent methyltransferase [Acidimicrobiales bacterium]